MIVVIDYGMGNLGSVAKALRYLGHDAVISDDPRQAAEADRLILPGVGAIHYAMNQLRQRGLDEAIRRFIQHERPFLGICLGMQLMFETSEEGEAEGLAILPGSVRRFPMLPGLKIPHMGWNQLLDSRSPLLSVLTDYYFVHSYYVEPADMRMTAAQARHGISFTAAVQTGSILLTQFHPEKSGRAGLDLLDRWVRSSGQHVPELKENNAI